MSSSVWILVGRGEILADLEHPPAAAPAADAQIRADELAADAFNSLPGQPLTMSTPKCQRQSVALRRVESLDDEDDRINVVRNRLQPRVVLFRVFPRASAA